MPILPLAWRKLRRHVRAARALVYVLILLLILAASLAAFAGAAAPGLSVSDVTVTEGDSGTIDAVFTVTLTRRKRERTCDTAV